MTLAVSADIQQPPPIGSLLYLASYLIKLGLKAEITPPDTPNMYSADLEIQGDQGDMNLDALVGPRGFPGKAQFPLRRQDTPLVNNTDELPDYLTNTTEDIGKYWVIDTVVDGVVTEEWSWVWYGTSWRKIQMGTTGVPGALPEISVDTINIPPQAHPTYPDTTSFVDTAGPRLAPSWRFNLPVPQGIPGAIKPIHQMPDVNLTSTVPVAGDMLACSGQFDSLGRAIWKPLGISHFATQYYSVPESAFSSYSGVAQQAAIGSFAIPPQPFPWTPIVWGHLGAGGATLSARPLMIGCQVLLGDAQHGVQVSRGLGNALGEVNIMPHYSTPTKLSANITPTNRTAHVPAHHTGAQGTIYMNLWNDGTYGSYSFNPANAQLFILVLPLERGVAIAPFAEEVTP